MTTTPTGRIPKIDVEPLELQFHDLDSDLKETISFVLKNYSPKPLAFAWKVNTKALAKYNVYYAVGLLPARSALRSTVTKSGPAEWLEGVKDDLFVLSTAFIDDVDLQKPPAEVWRTIQAADVAGDIDISHQKVPVTFIRPTWEPLHGISENLKSQIERREAVERGQLIGEYTENAFGGSRAELGSGSFGNVSMGFAKVQGKGVQVVAIKKLHRVNKEQKHLLKDLKPLLCTVVHPNIVPILGYTNATSATSKPYTIVTPYYPHREVCDYVQKTRAGKEKRIELIKDVARGVHYLQDHPDGIIHGDLKGNNILVNEAGRAVIIDFGVSKDSILDNQATTSSFGGGGHWRYQAPELLLDGDKTLSTDVFGFGCVALEIATGQWPLKHLPGTPLNVSLAIVEANKGHPIQTRPEDYPQVPTRSPLWSIMTACWETKPLERPKMGRVLAGLEGLSDRGSSSTLNLYDPWQWGHARRNDHSIRFTPSVNLGHTCHFYI